MNAKLSQLVLLVAALALVAFGTGCRQVCLSDNVDTTLNIDFSPVSACEDELHGPYVQGARIFFSVETGGLERDNEQSWRLASSNPEVLRPDEPGSEAPHAYFVAVGPGTAEIMVIDPADPEDPVQSVTVEVRRPTRAELSPRGRLLLGEAPESAAVAEANVLVGGEAMFVVRFFDGEQLLGGSGALSVRSTAVPAEPWTTTFSADRDWLWLGPTQETLDDIEILAGGVSAGHFRVRGVPASVVAGIELIGKDEGGASAGQELYVLAQPRDDDGNPVYGAGIAWDLDGAVQAGSGDLFAYSYDPERPAAALGAALGGLRAQASVHAAGGHAESSGSWSSVGCSAAPGLPGRGAPLLLAAALAAAVLARSRRPRAR